MKLLLRHFEKASTHLRFHPDQFIFHIIRFRCLNLHSNISHYFCFFSSYFGIQSLAIVAIIIAVVVGGDGEYEFVYLNTTPIVFLLIFSFFLRRFFMPFICYFVCIFCKSKTNFTKSHTQNMVMSIFQVRLNEREK